MVRPLKKQQFSNQKFGPKKDLFWTELLYEPIFDFITISGIFGWFWRVFSHFRTSKLVMFHFFSFLSFLSIVMKKFIYPISNSFFKSRSIFRSDTKVFLTKKQENKKSYLKLWKLLWKYPAREQVLAFLKPEIFRFL